MTENQNHIFSNNANLLENDWTGEKLVFGKELVFTLLKIYALMDVLVLA